MELPFYKNVPPELQEFITTEILPLYTAFDAAHQRDHAETVIQESMHLSQFYKVQPAMVYTIAACHDLGLCEGREHHHEISGRIIRNMDMLHQWFTAEEIEVMAEAAEDHRASAKQAPRSIYGKIVAEADRLIDVDLVLSRTLQYGYAHYPELSKAEHFQRMLQHLHEKYAEGGYLKLWIPESPNAQRLEKLRSIIAQPSVLHEWFETHYEELAPKHCKD